MWPTMKLAEGLEKMAELDAMTITISAGDSSSVTSMPPWEALWLAEHLRKDLAKLQQDYVRQMAERRAMMASGVAQGRSLIAGVHDGHADLLSWLSDDQPSLVDAIGKWVLELHPMERLAACRAVATGDVDALDRLAPRWRHGGPDAS